MDDAKREVEEWELLHPNNDDDSIVFAGPPLDSIRPDHFSLLDDNLNPNSSCSSNSSSEVDRNFDDSYVANQIFPNQSLWNGDSDSDSDIPRSEPVVEEAQEEKIQQVVEKDKRLVWWKVPFEVLRYWVNPLPLSLPLSVAAAAAFLGLFLLGRTLYRMKRKTQTFNLNLALDDKVPHFLSITFSEYMHATLFYIQVLIFPKIYCYELDGSICVVA
ncbi:hypothetical protein AAZX31_06G302100 [Glycine max]